MGGIFKLKLKNNSLDWALKHAIKAGDTDLMPPAFEYLAIKEDWSNIKQYISDQNIHIYTTRSSRTCFVPKSKHGFRIATQLDPLDFLIFTALVYEIGEDIENDRIEPKDKTVFSYRFQPDDNGEMFSHTIGYQAFTQEAENIASESDYKFVVVSDIADFYQRIYLHRLEGALHRATNKANHIKAIDKLLSKWNVKESYGIPIGNASSRLLAEITISDVDKILQGNNIKFIRFNDDYRIFAKTKTEAYRHLAFLADTLYNCHGLCLNASKTKILPSNEFIDKFINRVEKKETNALRQKFQSVMTEAGISSYEEVDLEYLSDEAQTLIKSLNLKDLFSANLQKEELDIESTVFILRRLGQLNDKCLVDDIFQNLESLYPVFSDIIKYLKAIKSFTPDEKKDIGAKLITLLKTPSIINELPYHKIWALDIFATSSDWGEKTMFYSLLNQQTDLPTRRKLILSMGQALGSDWFQSKWRHLNNEAPWVRRAILIASSCQPHAIRKHWYLSVEPSLDILEKAVLKFAKNNPLNKN